MLEMSRPKASAPTRNNDTMPTSTTHEPRIGMSNNRIAATTMLIDEISETTKYGAVLPSTYGTGPIGDIRTCSIVPASFSRTIDSAVETTAVSIAM